MIEDGSFVENDNPTDTFEPLEEAFSDADVMSEPSVGLDEEPINTGVRPSCRTAQVSRAQTRALASEGLL